MKIPFFNYPAVFKNDEEEYVKIFKDVCGKGAYILQQELQDFEKELAEFTGAKYAFGVANGTDALVISLKAAGIKSGDEVILPSHTYIATAAAVHFVGAKPVLADCGEDHMLAADKIEELITDKTTAIMPVQLNGRTCNMDTIMQIATKHNLIVVEDSAQALGSTYKGQSAGTFGAAGTISFYPAKVMGCFGDGGAILTNDDNVAEQVSLLRDHGRNAEGEVVAWGYNSRLDNLQAAFLQFKLKTYRNDIARRREIASLYNEGLKDNKHLQLPCAPSTAEHFDVYQNYELEADNRDELRQFLSDAGIGTLIQWNGTPVHHFDKLGLDDFTLPRTDKLFKRCFMLPMYPALTNEQVEYIIDTVNKFYG